MALNMITNRTAADVKNAKRIREKVQRGQQLTDSETQEFYNGLRGAYNISDINRVMHAMEYIIDFIRSQGYGYIFKPWQEWTNNDILKESDWRDYLNRVKAVRAYLPLPPSVPQAPETLFAIDAYRLANNIEKILVELEIYINKMIQSYYFVGELYAGEV